MRVSATRSQPAAAAPGDAASRPDAGARSSDASGGFLAALQAVIAAVVPPTPQAAAAPASPQTASDDGSAADDGAPDRAATPSPLSAADASTVTLTATSPGSGAQGAAILATLASTGGDQAQSPANPAGTQVQAGDASGDSGSDETGAPGSASDPARQGKLAVDATATMSNAALLMQVAMSARTLTLPPTGPTANGASAESRSAPGLPTGAVGRATDSSASATALADDGDDAPQPSHVDAAPQVSAAAAPGPHDPVVAASGSGDATADDASDNAPHAAKDNKDDHDGSGGATQATATAANQAPASTAAATSAAPTYVAAALTHTAPSANQAPDAPQQMAPPPPQTPAPPPPARAHVTLAVDPDLTGASHIHVAVQGTQVKATITASDGNVTIIDRQLPDLRRSLEDKGFADVRLAVHSSDHDAPALLSSAGSGMSDDPRAGLPAPARGRSDSQQQTQQRQSGSGNPDQDNASNSRQYREEPEEDAA